MATWSAMIVRTRTSFPEKEDVPWGIRQTRQPKASVSESPARVPLVEAESRRLRGTKSAAPASSRGASGTISMTSSGAAAKRMRPSWITRPGSPKSIGAWIH